jgi:hypothetical protein
VRTILVVALLLVPSLAFAGQAVGQLSVGIRIVASPGSLKAVRTVPRNAFSAANAPSRRYVREGRHGVRIHVTEF